MIILKEWKVNLLSAIFLVACAGLFIPFLAFHETRVDSAGWVFSDPVMNLLPVKDVSFYIFTLTYGSLLVYLVMFYKKSKALAVLMISYGLLILFRMLTMSVLPLKEPESIVFLNDPFLNNLIYPGKIDTDLFFSGHTALIIVMFFLSERQRIFAFLALVLGVLLMVQRVHYSIDILGAIPFAYLAYWLSTTVLYKWSLGKKA